ncbi:MAG: hypothetical protein P1U63_11715 [Coxiellaceae bacterium]|nr:hypothetical protein [Coxiellaceae bacterium]
MRFRSKTVITKELGRDIAATLPQLQAWIDEVESVASESKEADVDNPMLPLLKDLHAVLSRLATGRNLNALMKAEDVLHEDTGRLVAAADVGLRKSILPRCDMSHRLALMLMNLLTTKEFTVIDSSALDKVIVDAMGSKSSKTPFMQAIADHYGAKPLKDLLTRVARTFGSVNSSDIHGPICVQVAHIKQYEWFRERQLAKQQREAWLVSNESLLDDLGKWLVTFAQYKYKESLPVDITPELLEGKLKAAALIKPEETLDTASFDSVKAAYAARMTTLYAEHDRLVPYSIDPEAFYELMTVVEAADEKAAASLHTVFDSESFNPDKDALTGFIRSALQRDQALTIKLTDINPTLPPMSVASTHYAQQYNVEAYAEAEALSESLPVRMKMVLDAYKVHTKVVKSAEDVSAIEELSVVVAKLQAQPLDKAGVYQLVVTLYQLRYQRLVHVKDTPEAKITDTAAIFLSLQPLVHQLVNCFTLQTDRHLHAGVMSGFAAPRLTAPVGGPAVFQQVTADAGAGSEVSPDDDEAKPVAMSAAP